MTFHQLKSRRDFLALGCRTLSTIGAAAAFGQAGLISAKAQTVSDYKALVCIFLYGGNDCNNLLIPNDKSTYAAYQTIRQNLAIAQGSLVSIATRRAEPPSACILASRRSVRCIPTRPVR